MHSMLRKNCQNKRHLIDTSKLLIKAEHRFIKCNYTFNRMEPQKLYA